MFRDGYRHVVDYLRAEGVDNAVYIWHSADPIGLSGSAFHSAGNADALLLAVKEAFAAVG